jgi:hypothetical protein
VEHIIHPPIFPVEVKSFQVTKTKTKTVKAKTVRQPATSTCANRNSVDAADEIVQCSIT